MALFDLNNPILFGILFGFVPAMVLLYWVLGRYEGYFDEKRVFKYLLVGIVAGALIVVLEVAVLRFNTLTDFAWALLLFIVGYAALETLAKTVVLNWKSLQRRRDTPYFGAAFGLGFGGGMAMAIVTQRAIETIRFGAATDEQIATWLFFAILLQLTLGGLLIHAATAVMIAYGAAEDLLIVWTINAAAATLPLHLAEYLIFSTAWAGSIVLPTVILAYGLGLTLWAIRRILDKVVPPEIARQVEIDKRRDARAEREP